MQCPTCQAQIPVDARFCIECGEQISLSPATTGPTVQLAGPRPTAIACRSCGASNPDHAIFCVMCGQRVDGSSPRVAKALTPLPTRPVGLPATRMPTPLPASAPPPFLQRLSPFLPAAFFLIGIAFLLMTRRVWPGIFVVAGLSGVLAQVLAGRMREALIAAVWVIGLTVAFTVPGLFLPAIFLSIGASVVLRTVVR